MCFVVIGYEHCIANMFFIPLGMMLGAPVTAADMVAANLVPATLGNIAGGGIFVGGLYWYLNRNRGQSASLSHNRPWRKSKTTRNAEKNFTPRKPSPGSFIGLSSTTTGSPPKE